MHRPKNPRFDRGQHSDNTHSRRFHLYDPYEPKSDSDEHPSPVQSEDSQKSRGHWDTDESTRSRRSRWSPRPPRSPVRDDKPAERDIYGSRADHRETGHRAADYRPEIATTVRQTLSTNYDKLPSPPLQSQRKRPSRFSDPEPYPGFTTEIKYHGTKNRFNCDLCELDLSNGPELQEHMDSKTHWDTLEYIQIHNEYDDMTIAFIQDVMLRRSWHKCKHRIEDTELESLQENNFMTKIELFQCAACKVYVPTSTSAVQLHINSQAHITMTKDYETRQKRSSLIKAVSLMKNLSSRYQAFKGVFDDTKHQEELNHE